MNPLLNARLVMERVVMRINADGGTPMDVCVPPAPVRDPLLIPLDKLIPMRNINTAEKSA